MNRWRESCGRTGWVAADALRALARHRLMLVGLAGAVLLMVAGLVLRTIDFGGAPERFVVDFHFAALAFFGSGVAIVGTAQLVFADRESGATAMVLAKPVHRIEYLLGQWMAVMLVLGLLCVGVAVLVVVMAGRPVAAPEQWGEAAPVRIVVLWPIVLAAAGAQWLKFGVVVAGTLLVASQARSSLFTILFTGTLLVIAYLRTTAQHHYAHGGVIAWIGRWGLELIPDLRLFEVADAVTTAGATLGPPALLILAAYAALYAGGYLVLAGWMCRRRDD